MILIEGLGRGDDLLLAPVNDGGYCGARDAIRFDQPSSEGLWLPSEIRMLRISPPISPP